MDTEYVSALRSLLDKAREQKEHYLAAMNQHEHTIKCALRLEGVEPYGPFMNAVELDRAMQDHSKPNGEDLKFLAECGASW